MNFWRIYTSVILMFLFLPGYSGDHENPGNPLLTDHQKNVITYFKEIALGFEFGKGSKVTRKWTTPMRIFVGGSANETLIHELQRLVEELNTLITDEVEIEIVTRREASNFYIFLGTGSEYAAAFPREAHLVDDNSGIYNIYWNGRDEIVKGHMFVKTSTSEKEQRHVLREELTQALGLGNDSPLYSDSIFQSTYTTPTEYSTIDKHVIRLLYHPGITAGLSASEVEAVLAEILVAEGRSSIY